LFNVCSFFLSNLSFFQSKENATLNDSTRLKVVAHVSFQSKIVSPIPMSSSVNKKLGCRSLISFIAFSLSPSFLIASTFLHQRLLFRPPSYEEHRHDYEVYKFDHIELASTQVSILEAQSEEVGMLIR
jgi:hypothetical protein